MREERDEGSSDEKFTKKPEAYGREIMGSGPIGVLLESGENLLPNLELFGS